MLARIVFRYGTSAQWTDANPVLAAGEPGFDTSVGSLKVGDGVKTWTELEYQTTDPAELDAILVAVQAAQAAAEQAAQDAEDAAASATGATDAGVFTIISDTSPPDNTTRTLLDSLYAAITHTHTADEVTDLADAIETLLEGFLVEGTNIDIVHSGGTFTISSTATGTTGLNKEELMDFLGSVSTPAAGLKGAGLIAVTYDDAAAGGEGTLTISTTATQNSSDATLLNRANHTGTADESLRVAGNDWMTLGNPSALQIGRVAIWDGNSWEHGVLDLTRFPTKDSTGGGLNGSIRQLADVADTAFFDGAIPQYDVASGALVPVDPTARFAEADPDTGKLFTTEMPKYGMFGVIVNEGEQPPQDLPVGLGYPIVGFSRQAAPSIIPVMEDGGFVLADDAVVLQNAEAYVAGDDLIVVAGTSGEATLPSSFTVTIESPGVAPVTERVEAVQSGSAQCNIYQGKVTTDIPAGSDLTISCLNPSAVAQNRAQFHAVILKGLNLASAPYDTNAVLNTGSSGVLDVVIGPTSAPIAQANTLGIMALVFNSGTGATVRTIAPTNGWQQLYNAEAESGAGRTLLVAYKVFDAVGNPTGNAHITASDAATGAMAGACIYLKAA